MRSEAVLDLLQGGEHPEELGVYSGYPKKRTISSDEDSLDRETIIHLSLARALGPRGSAGSQSVRA